MICAWSPTKCLKDSLYQNNSESEQATGPIRERLRRKF